MTGFRIVRSHLEPPLMGRLAASAVGAIARPLTNHYGRLKLRGTG